MVRRNLSTAPELICGFRNWTFIAYKKHESEPSWLTRGGSGADPSPSPSLSRRLVFGVGPCGGGTLAKSRRIGKDAFPGAGSAEAAQETAQRDEWGAAAASQDQNGRCNNLRDFGRGASLAYFAVASCSETVVS